MNKKNALVLVAILAIAINIYAIYVGFFVYVFSCWNLQEGEPTDWLTHFFFLIAFINIIVLTFKLSRNLILLLRRTDKK